MAKITSEDRGKRQGRSPAKTAAATGAQCLRLDVLKQFWVLLRSIRHHQQWVEKECGLNSAQLWTVMEIAGTPGIKVSDLARRLRVHPSTASNVLRSLEGSSLVERRRVGRDQRVVHVHLTAKGRKILRGAARPLEAILQQALTGIPQRRLNSFHADLEEIIRQMKVKNAEAGAAPLAEI